MKLQLRQGQLVCILDCMRVLALKLQTLREILLDFINTFLDECTLLSVLEFSSKTPVCTFYTGINKNWDS